MLGWRRIIQTDAASSPPFFMKKPQPLEARIERIPESGCWIWMGATNDDGYGRIYWRDPVSGLRRHRTAHRWVYETHNGPIHSGMSVLHSCDVPCCVNPAHLYLGTQTQNISDRVVRGRNGGMKIAGEANKAAKLTWAIVNEIRASGLGPTEVSRRYGIGLSHAARILRRENWKG